jgi:hypothetical protein
VHYADKPILPSLASFASVKESVFVLSRLMLGMRGRGNFTTKTQRPIFFTEGNEGLRLKSALSDKRILPSLASFASVKESVFVLSRCILGDEGPRAFHHKETKGTKTNLFYRR